MDATRVIKANVQVYFYVRPDNTVERTTVWDETITLVSLHKYNDEPRGDDAGEQLGDADEAQKAYEAAEAAPFANNWPAWDFGC